VKFLLTPITRNKISIFLFHRVHNESDIRFYDPTVTEFDALLGFLKKFFNFLRLDEAVQRLQTGTLPKNAAVITFDDGYKDNYTNALPILLKHNVPASFYVTTGFIGGGCMWNDKVIHSIVKSPNQTIDLQELGIKEKVLSDTTQRKAFAIEVLGKVKHMPYSQRLDVVENICEVAGGLVPNDLMMSVEEVKALHASGMEIGGHTVTHPILTSLDKKEAISEISQGKETLEFWLGEPLKTFAYPNGKPNADYNLDHVNSLKGLGFKAAVSTAWGVTHKGSDLYQLPRFTPWDKTNWKFLARMLLNYRNTQPDISR
jgi:peptidoglycan/xylan/chitin deacetylase (PgdA/CDA1 family)